MNENSLKQHVISKNSLGLSRDEIYMLAMMEFGSDDENLILLLLGQELVNDEKNTKKKQTE